MARVPESWPEDVRDTFQYCDDCGAVVVNLDSHSCPDDPAPTHRTPDERAALAAQDDRPRDEEVLYPLGRSTRNAWAYHELDEDGEPLHIVDHESGQLRGSREEAIEQGCFPCGQCRRIEERRTDS